MTKQHTLLRLELNLAALPIEGTLEHEDGVVQAFSGWMQLSQSVEEALERARLKAKEEIEGRKARRRAGDEERG